MLRVIAMRDDIGKAGILDPFQPTLNECLWEGENLRPEIRQEIMQIAEELGQITGIKINDLLMYGGSAGYQYSGDSDIDVSVYPEIDENFTENYEKNLNVFRGRIEEICGLELHFFLKNQKEPELREANENVYNITDNSWVTKPTRHDFNPFEEWADKIMEAQEIEKMINSEMSLLEEYLVGLRGSGLGLETTIPVLDRFADIIRVLREKRKSEHLKLREKAIKEDISVEDRATSNEIIWKYLDQVGLLKKLDFIRKAVDQFEEKEELSPIINEQIRPIHQDLY